MRKISLFAEDTAHETVLSTLIVQRLAPEFDVQVSIRPVSVTGGFPRVADQLEQYVKELLRFNESLPDAIVVATDSNCIGYRERRMQLEKVAEPIKDNLVFAVPDPHIEKWLLLDSKAFSAVVGKGCNRPAEKCERDRYKRLLIEAIQDAGLEPLIGGIEHAADIIRLLDLSEASKHDDLGRFLGDMRAKLRLWGKGSLRDEIA